MSELKQWLERHGLGEFAEPFAKERIELGDLVNLSENDLRELGLLMGPRKRFLEAVQRELASSHDPTEPATALPPISPLRYTPQGVAERILGARASVEGERKQVTILFADVKGSTSMVESLDPEDATALLDPVLIRMIEAVHRYDGTVNRVQGDGIMAMFGAPLAHEDHALRACRAALDIREISGESTDAGDHVIEVRVGINSGEVVVRAIHNDLTMSYDAVGLTAHLAARMEQVAASGTVCLTGETLRLVEGFVSATARGPTQIKGISEPLDVYTLEGMTGALNRVDARPVSDLTEFVGRDRELENIEDCLSSARSGQGRVVLIVGEPGMGKSRLILEMRARLGAEFGWLEGHSLSFAHSMPFHPFPKMLRRYFAIDENDSVEVIGKKVEGAVRRLDPDLLSTLPYLRYLLGVDPGERSVEDMDPQLRRAEVFDAFRRFIVTASKHRPLVLLIEDLHWADLATEELIGFVAESVPSSRLLCVLTYRPNYVHRLGERTYIARVVLEALDEDATAKMARAVLKTARLPLPIEKLIQSKAEGNPFFVEEVTRSVFETGGLHEAEDAFELVLPIDDIRVPETIQGVIMARVDRLDELPRKTLQLASILGREFTVQALELMGELADTASPVGDWLSDVRGRVKESLRQVQSVELIYERATDVSGTYAFKHALTQEVVYGSLLMERRRELHRFAGPALEKTLGNRVSENHELLAHHYFQAEEWEQALAYVLLAAGKATDAFSTREAIALYDHALELANRLPEAQSIGRRIQIHQAKADQHFLVSEFEQAREEGASALALARRDSNHTAEGKALVSMGLASWLNHDFPRALNEAEQAVNVGSAIDDQSIVAGGYLTTGLVYEMTGRLEEAGEKLDDVVRISRAIGDTENESWALVFAAEIKGWEASFDEASQLYLQGIETARAQGVLLPQLEGLFMYGINLTGKGRYDGAFAALDEGLALAEKVGDENYTPRYLNSLGWLCAESGDFERAVELNQRGSENARRRGDHEAVANAELNLADIALAQGDLGLAHDVLEAVHKAVKDPSTSEWMRWRYSMHLFTSLAELSLARGDGAGTRKYAEQCLELALRTNSRKYIVHGWRLHGCAAGLSRNWQDAEAALLKALPIAEAIASPTPLWKAHLSLAQIKSELQHAEAASNHYQAAVGVIDCLRDGLRGSEIARTLDHSPAIQQLHGLRDQFRP